MWTAFPELSARLGLDDLNSKERKAFICVCLTSASGSTFQSEFAGPLSKTWQPLNQQVVPNRAFNEAVVISGYFRRCDSPVFNRHKVLSSLTSTHDHAAKKKAVESPFLPRRRLWALDGDGSRHNRPDLFDGPGRGCSFRSETQREGSLQLSRQEADKRGGNHPAGPRKLPQV